MGTCDVDLLRDVPEAAVRLFCGAGVERQDDSVVISLDGRSIAFPLHVYFEAIKVLDRLRPRAVASVSDVLELRHEAEDLFLENLFHGDKKVPKVLFVPCGTTAGAYYRAMIPSDVASGRGDFVAHFTHRLDLSKALRYDVLWIQLVASPILVEIAGKAKERGVKIVYDLDDDPWSIPHENPASAVYTSDHVAVMESLMRMADLVTVSTAYLGEKVSGRLGGSARVKVLPNLLPCPAWPKKARPSGAERPIRILWAGSPTHRIDLDVCAEALGKVLIRHKGGVRLTLFGETPPERLGDARVFVDVIRPVNFEDYPATLAEVGADVAIAPLKDIEFNRSKSAIKALEYGACGYPMILSPVGEYPKVVADGLKASLVRDGEWEAALEDAVSRRSELAEIGEECSRWVRSNRCLMGSRAQQWVDVATEIVSYAAVA